MLYAPLILLLKCIFILLAFRIGYRTGLQDRSTINPSCTTTTSNTIPIKTINDIINTNNNYKCDANGNRVYDACDSTHSKSQFNYLYKMEYYLNDSLSNYDKNLIRAFYSGMS